MVNATAGVVSPHGTGMCAGARDMVRLGIVRCCYRAQRWGPVMCAVPSSSVTEDIVSKPRRLPRYNLLLPFSFQAPLSPLGSTPTPEISLFLFSFAFMRLLRMR